MRKITAIILCLLTLALLLGTALAVEPLAVTVAADKTTVKAGEEVVFTVSIPEVADCKSGAVRIQFDSAAFERTGNKWLLENTALADPNGDAVFMYGEPKSLSGKGFQFTLKAKKTTSANAEVTV